MNFKRSKSLLALCTIVFLYSCNSELDGPSSQDNSSFQKIDGRIAFVSQSEAIKQLSELSSKSEEELIEWEKNIDFNSLRSTIDYHSQELDTMLLYFPSGLATVLNAEKEYQYGDTIVWFYKNNVFKVPNTNEILLAQIKNEPENPEYASFKTNFIAAPRHKSKINGRVIPGYLSVTTPFRPWAANMDYRFHRDLKSIYTGVNYTIQLENCLAYRASNGNWYLAGESVYLKRIGGVVAYAEPGITWNYDVSFGELYNNNGYLRVNVINSITPFAGSIKATFRHELYTSHAGWITFIEDVTWY